MVVTAGYTRREKRNQLGSATSLFPSTRISGSRLSRANSGQTVTVFNQAPNLRGRIDQLWDNDTEMDSTYNGGDITVNKRLSNRWMLTGGVSLGKNVGYVGTADLNNPNSKEFSRGVQGNDVPFSLSMSGLYELPYGISLSGSYQHQAGFPELTTVSVGNNTVALTQGTQAVTTAPRADVRYPKLNQLDFSLRKAIRFGSRVFSRGSTSTT